MGCSARPPQAVTTKLLPDRFVGPVPTGAPTWPTADWWRHFDSPELSKLIALAQTSNRNVAAAAARLQQANANVRIQRAALFPTIDVQSNAERIGVRGGAISTSGLGIPNETINNFNLSGNAGYDLDLWGLSRNNWRAAREGAKSARFSQLAVALEVTADVANAYFNILAAREQIAITKENIAAIEGILDIVRLKVTAGTVSNLDLAQEQAQVESVKAQLPALNQREIAERAALSVLVGIVPESLQVETESTLAIQMPTVQPGLPSELLQRRPDVAEAEANLSSAHANLQAARAAFLPQIALNGSAGFSSAALSALLHGPSFLWDGGAQLVQTIFDGGKLAGAKDLAKAKELELLAVYEDAVLQAYADVEVALGEVQNMQEEERQLKAEVAAAAEAFKISDLQYRQGTADLLTVLQTQETLFSARDQLIQVRLARIHAIVQLYVALGGGWKEAFQDRTQFASSATTIIDVLK
jgi:NodT family efflux transporter outer membrane factor (OMF) lipoprotein